MSDSESEMSLSLSCAGDNTRCMETGRPCASAAPSSPPCAQKRELFGGTACCGDKAVLSLPSLGCCAGDQCRPQPAAWHRYKLSSKPTSLLTSLKRKCSPYRRGAEVFESELPKRSILISTGSAQRVCGSARKAANGSSWDAPSSAHTVKHSSCSIGLPPSSKSMSRTSRCVSRLSTKASRGVAKRPNAPGASSGFRSESCAGKDTSPAPSTKAAREPPALPGRDPAVRGLSHAAGAMRRSPVGSVAGRSGHWACPMQ